MSPHQVGLAVDDIKAVQEQAVLKRLAMQVCWQAHRSDSTSTSSPPSAA